MKRLTAILLSLGLIGCNGLDTAGFSHTTYTNNTKEDTYSTEQKTIELEAETSEDLTQEDSNYVQAFRNKYAACIVEHVNKYPGSDKSFGRRKIINEDYQNPKTEVVFDVLRLEDWAFWEGNKRLNLGFFAREQSNAEIYCIEKLIPSKHTPLENPLEPTIV